MKKALFTSLLLVFYSMSVFSQVIFSENMGDNPVNTDQFLSPNTYTGFQNYGTGITFHRGSDRVTVRSTEPSANYENASGGNNIFFSALDGEKTFTIANIPLNNTANLELQFGIYKNIIAQDGSDMHISVIIDGGTPINLTLNNLPTVDTTTQGWYKRVFPLPATGNSATIIFESVASGTNNWIRIDDVSIVEDAMLPVSFDFVTAAIQKNELSVDWSTNAENSCDHFNILASTDGKTFKKIGQVSSKAANGNSGNRLVYHFSLAASSVYAISVAGFLFIGISIHRRKRIYRWLGVFVLTAVVALSCSKESTEIGTNKNKALMIQIEEVDKDGGTQLSKVVVAQQKD